MKLVCIKCPKGCELTVDGEKITGNQCLRGIDYAKEEITSPKRIVTSLVKTSYGIASVKTSGEVPKEQINNVLDAISRIKVDKTKIGDVLIKNCIDLGVDIVVTGNINNTKN